MTNLLLQPCLDSEAHGNLCRDMLMVPRMQAAELGRSAVKAAEEGVYRTDDGREVRWKHLVDAACAQKLSIPPDQALPKLKRDRMDTRVQVANETTLEAAKRLVNQGLKVMALNFANGVNPGGGFLHGARAQEEVLCRSSALYMTLRGDPMYQAHSQRPLPDSTSWAILSPSVPVFRLDDGTLLDAPWTVSFLTCAAPYAPAVGQPKSGDLLKERIHRVLSIASAYGYEALILGAWGCGAFANAPWRTAQDFRQALEGDFARSFSEVVFAVTDWSPERRFLGPFCKVFTT
jgi:uncharacterized protein (TIGR02452 family)